VIKRGEVVTDVEASLVEPTGNYESGTKYIGAPGGHVLQIYYTLEEIFNRYPHGLK